VNVATEKEIYVRKSLLHLGPSYKFSEWGKERGELLKEQLDIAYAALAQKIFDKVFLEFY
jgi:hypothetical protein